MSRRALKLVVQDATACLEVVHDLPCHPCTEDIQLGLCMHLKSVRLLHCDAFHAAPPCDLVDKPYGEPPAPRSM